MDGRGRIRFGFILTSISSIIILLTTAFLISGFLNISHIVYTEEDFQLVDDREFLMNYSSSHLEILIFNFRSNKEIDVELTVIDGSDIEIFNEEGTTDTQMSVTFEESGEYQIHVKLTDPRDHPEDLGIDVQRGGAFFYLFYCFSISCFYTIAVSMIITGSIFAYSGYMKIRSEKEVAGRW